MRDLVTRSLLTFALVGALAGCGSDSPTSPASASIAGTYRMRTINGSPLPFTIQSGTTVVVITGDVITVADGGTWSEQGAFTRTSGGQTTNQVISDGGTWARVGANVALYSNSTNGYAGSFTGSGFTFADATFTYVFSR
jgi:hypothetical protein